MNNMTEDFLQPLKIKFVSTHPDSQLPRQNYDSDTGYDLFAVEDTIVPAKNCATIPTGIQVAEVPYGIWFLILPRSGLGFKHSLQPHLGVIDNHYRGDLGVKLYNFSDTDYKVTKGDRIAQLAFFPLLTLKPEWTSNVQETDRGQKGFESSGK